MHDELPLLQRTAKVSRTRRTRRHRVPRRGDHARRRGRAAVRQDAAPTSTARPRSAASPARARRVARRGVGALVEQLAQTGVLAFVEPTTTATHDRRASSTSSTARYATPLAAAESTTTRSGRRSSPARPRARRCSASPSRSTTTSRARTSTWRIAAANATPEMMPHLARHFIEEYNHGDIYRKGLRSLFPDDVVLRAQPLPSTRALVNFLSEIGGAQLVRLLRGQRAPADDREHRRRRGGQLDRRLLRRRCAALPVHRQADRLVHRAHPRRPEARARERLPGDVRRASRR